MQASVYEAVEITCSITSENMSQSPYYAQGYEGKVMNADKKYTIPLYYKGNKTWALRFAPSHEGIWHYTIYNYDKVLMQGEVNCEGERGFASPLFLSNYSTIKDKKIFATNNQPFLINGYECNWLFSLWMSNKAKAQQFLLSLKRYRFNTILMNVYAHQCTWTQEGTKGLVAPPPYYLWRGSNESPDFDAFNETFLSSFDELLSYMSHIGMYSYLYFFVFNKKVQYPEKWSKQETLYIKQIVSRFQGFPNVMWCYAKETYNNSDKEHVKNCLRLIKETDVFHHLLTTHDDRILQRDKETLSLIDFISLQQHADFYFYIKELADETHKPIFDTEFGYEADSKTGEITYQEKSSISDYISVAWDVLFAGSPSCYYYTFTAWDVIRCDDRPQGYALFKNLYDFFDTIEWWNFQPMVDGPLSTSAHYMQKENAMEYVIKATYHGTAILGIDSTAHDFIGSTWFNPYTGESCPVTAETYSPYAINPKRTWFKSPYKNEHFPDGFYILHLIAQPVQKSVMDEL